jgi:hypothetical protein
MARRSLRQVLCVSRSVWRRPFVPARRCCSAVRMTTSGWQRPQRARRSCVWAAGHGRGVGRITAATCASARASTAAVVANGPVARAKARACRGVTTTTGRPAVAQAPVPRRARPPVASSTLRVGWRTWRRSTRVPTPLASLGTAQRSPEGRRAISSWAFAPSMPTKHGTGLLRNFCLPGLANTGAVAPDNGTGVGRPGRDAPRAAPVSADPGSIGLSRPGTR